MHLSFLIHFNYLFSTYSEQSNYPSSGGTFFTLVLFTFCTCCILRCLACIVVSCLACIVVSCLACIVVSCLACIVVSCLACIVVSCLVCIVVVVLCVLLQLPCVYCCHMCICCTMCALLLVLQMSDCWLEVSIRKVLRPFTSTQVIFVSLCLKANAEIVPKIPSCHYMLLMQPSRLNFSSNQFHVLFTCKITTATG